MEFRQSGIGNAPVAPVAAGAAHEAQARQMLALMAKRQMHGARGILFIAGSIMLVMGLSRFAANSGILGTMDGGTAAVFRRWSDSGLNASEWTALGGITLGLTVLWCGWMVLRMPLVATIVPVLVLAGRIAAAIVQAALRSQGPDITGIVIDLFLFAFVIRALVEGISFHRHARDIREQIRFNALARVRERREQREAARGARPAGAEADGTAD
jgi:hypothetical protein